jgi:hypothetical protein
VECWTAMAEFKARWMMPSYAKNDRVAGRGTRSKSLGGVRSHRSLRVGTQTTNKKLIK